MKSSTREPGGDECKHLRIHILQWHFSRMARIRESHVNHRNTINMIFIGTKHTKSKLRSHIQTCPFEISSKHPTKFRTIAAFWNAGALTHHMIRLARKHLPAPLFVLSKKIAHWITTYGSMSKFWIWTYICRLCSVHGWWRIRVITWILKGFLASATFDFCWLWLSLVSFFHFRQIPHSAFRGIPAFLFHFLPSTLYKRKKNNVIRQNIKILKKKVLKFGN